MYDGIVKGGAVMTSGVWVRGGGNVRYGIGWSS